MTASIAMPFRQPWPQGLIPASGAQARGYFAQEALAPTLDWSRLLNFFRESRHAFQIRRETAGVAAVGLGIQPDPQRHRQINQPIQDATTRGRWVDARRIYRHGSWSTEITLGPAVRAEEIRREWIEEALQIATEPDAPDRYRSYSKSFSWLKKGRLRLLVPEAGAEMGTPYLLYENPETFALSHGGRGPRGKEVIAYLPYDLLARIMSIRVSARRVGDLRYSQTDRAVRFLLRHAWEQAQRKRRGQSAWENPVETNEILQLLTAIDVLPKRPTDRKAVWTVDELKRAYDEVWTETEASVLQPRPDLPLPSITLVSGSGDFTSGLNEALDGLVEDLRVSHPGVFAKIHPVAAGERHVSLFTLVPPWSGGPLGLSAISTNQRAHVQLVLRRHGTMTFKVRGFNMGKDGTGFVELEPVNETGIFDLRSTLQWMFPRPETHTPLLSITIFRLEADAELSVQESDDLKSWVRKHRHWKAGEHDSLTVVRPFLRLGDTLHAYRHAARERVRFHTEPFEASPRDRVTRWTQLIRGVLLALFAFGVSLAVDQKKGVEELAVVVGVTFFVLSLFYLYLFMAYPSGVIAGQFDGQPDLRTSAYQKLAAAGRRLASFAVLAEASVIAYWAQDPWGEYKDFYTEATGRTWDDFRNWPIALLAWKPLLSQVFLVVMTPVLALHWWIDDLRGSKDGLTCLYAAHANLVDLEIIRPTLHRLFRGSHRAETTAYIERGGFSLNDFFRTLTDKWRWDDRDEAPALTVLRRRWGALSWNGFVPEVFEALNRQDLEFDEGLDAFIQLNNRYFTEALQQLLEGHVPDGDNWPAQNLRHLSYTAQVVRLAAQMGVDIRAEAPTLRSVKDWFRHSCLQFFISRRRASESLETLVDLQSQLLINRKDNILQRRDEVLMQDIAQLKRQNPDRRVVMIRGTAHEGGHGPLTEEGWPVAVFRVAASAGLPPPPWFGASGVLDSRWAALPSLADEFMLDFVLLRLSAYGYDLARQIVNAILDGRRLSDGSQDMRLRPSAGELATLAVQALTSSDKIPRGAQVIHGLFANGHVDADILKILLQPYKILPLFRRWSRLQRRLDLPSGRAAA